MKKRLLFIGALLCTLALTACSSANDTTSPTSTSETTQTTSQPAQTTQQTSESSSAPASTEPSESASSSTEEQANQYQFMTMRNYSNMSVVLPNGRTVNGGSQTDDNTFEASFTVGDGQAQTDLMTAGTYTVTWQPGSLNGSDPNTAYALVNINGNETQVDISGSQTITLNNGDNVDVTMFGQGTGDILTFVSNN